MLTCETVVCRIASYDLPSGTWNSACSLPTTAPAPTRSRPSPWPGTPRPPASSRCGRRARRPADPVPPQLPFPADLRSSTRPWPSPCWRANDSDQGGQRHHRVAAAQSGAARQGAGQRRRGLGRPLVVGVGAGYIPRSSPRSGALAGRQARVDEHIQALRALWTMEHPRFTGGTCPSTASTPTPVRCSARGRRSSSWRGPDRADPGRDPGQRLVRLQLDVDATVSASTAAAAPQCSRSAVELGPLEITVTPSGPLDRGVVARYEDWRQSAGVAAASRHRRADRHRPCTRAHLATSTGPPRSCCRADRPVSC